MDFLLPPASTVELMASNSAQVPELESEESSLSPTLPPPPPLVPAPAAVTVMEEVGPANEISGSLTPTALPVVDITSDSPGIASEMVGEWGEIPRYQQQIASAGPPVASIVPELTLAAATVPGSGLQIMTRKRSSMSAAVNNGIADGGTACAAVPVAQLVCSDKLGDGDNKKLPEAEVPATSQPPKKKKKYTPKPKKTPTTGPDGVTNAVSKSAKSKTVTVPGTSEGPEAPKPAKPKKPSKPKPPKKSSAAGSSKSKSKDAKQAPPPACQRVINGSSKESKSNELDPSAGAVSQQPRPLVPPLKLQMPKLTKMPGTGSGNSAMSILPMKLKVKNEPQEDWDENNGEHLDTVEMNEHEDGSTEESGNNKGSSRKKKSKGRNGNIYIGVFNRIEWMKLQTEFGFGSVNNFGTFVLQTMRRVHGDIKFWCDVAVASGVYPDLDRYEWQNGFPQAVNKEGGVFTPEPDVKMSAEKREEVIEMAKAMWDERLQELKEQQQQEPAGGEEEVVTLESIPEEGEEDEEEEEDAMPDLENYLQNMASGQYSPNLGNGSDGGASGTGLTEEEVDRIWNEKMNDTASLGKFDKLFTFINSIATMGKTQRDTHEAGGIEKNVGVEVKEPVLAGSACRANDEATIIDGGTGDEVKI